MNKSRLKRFGRVSTEFDSEFETEYWHTKYGNNNHEPRHSTLIIWVMWDKKEYPKIEDIPEYRIIEFKLLDAKEGVGEK